MKKFNAIALLLVCLWAASCAPLRSGIVPTGEISTRCLPFFPDQDDWYGGDGAYSIALDERRSLWLFGDTFVSEEKERKDRIGMEVILGTTLAVSTCTGEQFSIRYYLKKANGKFASSFGGDQWFWPQDPFIANHVLYIPFLVIRALPGPPRPFHFEIVGHRIARIRDYSAEDPHDWPVDYLDWTGAIAPGIEALGTASVVHDRFVYFYPLYRSVKDGVPVHGNLLARLSVNGLENPAGHFEYWTSDGWRKEVTSKNARMIFSPGLSELSVRYLAEDGEWLAVYLSPENKGDRLLYATSRRPEGPWSAPAALIASIGEVDPKSPLYHPQTFCYAGKEHRQFARGRELVATYVCNSLEDIDDQESFLRRNLFLYRPVVRLLKR
ncbi:MAG: DUF4185 domain-containing protein [Smithellaceae bacterium]|nr:DUF4185 domain-containing protein [Smithellaceae bacterium]